MYQIEWIAAGEKVGDLGGWLKLVSAEKIQQFVVETLAEGGCILSIRAA